MEMLADIATRNGGIVLEVGFGLGLSAQYIQSHPLEKHIIIEANADVFARSLLKFALGAEKLVVPIYGLWQDVISLLPNDSIDGILFDTVQLSSDEMGVFSFPFFEHAYRILRKGGIFTYYSDEALDFSSQHLDALKQVGFSNIEKFVCDVTPPEGSIWWTANTMMAPIVIK